MREMKCWTSAEEGATMAIPEWITTGAAAQALVEDFVLVSPCESRIQNDWRDSEVLLVSHRPLSVVAPRVILAAGL